MLDLILREGRIFLGQKEGWMEGDLAIKGDKIAEIAPAISSPARQTLSVQGRVVAPGFIDVHAHDEIELLKTGRAYPKLAQGVTTVICGNCGLGFFPLAPGKQDLIRDYNKGLFDLEGVSLDWLDLAGFLKRIEKKQLGINAGFLVGHGALRTAVMGFARKKADKGQLEKMGELLEKALAQGALGLSTGLLYPPGSYADQEEIEYLARVLRQHDALYVTHMRSYSRQVLQCLKENLELARRTGVRLQISHFGFSGRASWGGAEAALELIREARAQGIDIDLDQYPYQAESTLISALLPGFALADGVETLLQKLKQSEPFRREIVRSLQDDFLEGDNLMKSAGPENVVINSSTSAAANNYMGKSIARIARDQNKGAGEVLLDLILKSGGEMTVIIFSLSPEDVKKLIAAPEVLVGSDGISGPQNPHPRLWGTFPRILGHYVREEQCLSLTEGLDKMTARPAKKFRLPQRGKLEAGFFADLIIFDPEKIQDRAQYENPRQSPRGIYGVWVNGQQVLENGVVNDKVRPGRMLVGKSGPGNDFLQEV